MAAAQGPQLLLAAWGLVACCSFAPFSAGGFSEPVFQLWTVEGESHTGRLFRLDATGAVTLTAAKSFTVPPRQWLTLRRDKMLLPGHPTGPQVVFANGDRVRLADKTRLRIVDNRLELQPHGVVLPRSAVLAPPLSSVAVLWLSAPDGTEEPAAYLCRLVSTPRKKDVVVLRDGERLEGTVVDLDSQRGCTLQVGKERMEVPWADVAAVAFSSELLHTPLPDHPYYHVVLADGTRLALTQARLDKGSPRLRGTALSGDQVEIPLGDLLALDVRRGAATYLSDLKPLKYEHLPYVGTAWPLVLDASVTGQALSVAGSTFDKGLGMHAESRVTYELGGKYRWFEARVGLDPVHGKRGRVRLRVFVDGKEQDLGWKKELTAADEPLTLRIDVRGGRELTLEVLFGTAGDVQAHVNWVDARLVE